jgi:PAS domain S-box-containing protein
MVSILLTTIEKLGSGSMDLVSLLIIFFTAIAFVITWVVNRISILRIRKRVSQIKESTDILQQTLDIDNSWVLRLDIKKQHADNLHGDLLPKGGMDYQESFNCIHPDDRHIYREFIQRLYNGEVISDECTFRWDMSGVKGLGQWRYMHDQGIAEYGQKKDVPIHIFCTLTDITEHVALEQKEREMTDKYRQTFEQSIVGQAFYDKDGNLLTANRKMREILKFQSEDDPYYYSNTLFDMPTFRDVLNKRRVEELTFCTKSVIIERGVNCYTELRLHPIYEDNGEMVFITLSIRDITQERELYLQNKRNSIEMRRANEAIQQYEAELQYLMDKCDMRFWRSTFADRTITFYHGLSTREAVMSFEELRNHFVDRNLKEELLNSEEYFSSPKTTLVQTHPFFHERDTLQWNIIDRVPYFNEEGQLLGTYGIIRNITPLIEKQQRLREETERAKDSGRLKSLFMANMTHEIRTPLNSIVGFSDVLPMLSTKEEKQEIIRVIMNNCDMLMRLINDILAISSLDTRGIHLEPKKVDFAKSFDDICESLRERVQVPGVIFIKENPYTEFVTYIDNGRILQVITNFVTNAVKYTRQGHIKVGYNYNDGTLYVYCEDTGTGIPKEHQSKIFERFVKLNDYIQGTGLGLSICKAIADSCQGQIGVDSEGDGHGSTFWLRIPCEELNSQLKN